MGFEWVLNGDYKEIASRLKEYLVEIKWGLSGDCIEIDLRLNCNGIESEFSLNRLHGW